MHLRRAMHDEHVGSKLVVGAVDDGSVEAALLFLDDV